MAKSKPRIGKVHVDDCSSNGRKIFVVSDLHIASGLNANGNYDGTENFFADQSFARFLDHLQQKTKQGKAILIINGDFIDFLRIRDVPKTFKSGEEPKDTGGLEEWRQELLRAGIDKTIDELNASIDEKEKKFGLKTHDFKTIWKLHCAVQGHRVFFKALARWIFEGNELYVLKGNHDLEWVLPNVQKYFRVVLESLAAEEAKKHSQQSQADGKGRIQFYDDALLVDERVYIEHGHQYEEMTAVKGSAMLNEDELRIPVGSFFNRYLVNQIELSYPYVDNIRPQQNILAILLRERPALALKLLLQYVPFVIRIIPKNFIKEAIKNSLIVIFLAAVPLFIIFRWFYLYFLKLILHADPVAISKFVQYAVLLFLYFTLCRFVAGLLSKKPPGFAEYADDILHKKGELVCFEDEEKMKRVTIEAVLFGHTHDPQQKNLTLKQNLQPAAFAFKRSAPKPKKLTSPVQQTDSTKNGTFEKEAAAENNKAQWYFNTGTWMPILEASTAELREDKTYTFITIDFDLNPPCQELLQRWNDDASREDNMILNDKI